MTSSNTASADLSKLRINRDAPPSRSQSGGRRIGVWILLFVLLAAAAHWVVRSRSAPEITVTTVAMATSSGGGAATSVTANGYVVARTKASVSAKAAGRLEYLGVSEGSFVQKGVVIARLDNTEFQAAIG